MYNHLRFTCLYALKISLRGVRGSKDTQIISATMSLTEKPGNMQETFLMMGIGIRGER